MNNLQRQKSLCMLLLQLKVIAFIFVLLTLMLALPMRAAELADETAFFENNIRPILVDSCYKCHSIEKNKVQRRLVPGQPTKPHERWR